LKGKCVMIMRFILWVVFAFLAAGCAGQVDDSDPVPYVAQPGDVSRAVAFTFRVDSRATPEQVELLHEAVSRWQAAVPLAQLEVQIVDCGESVWWRCSNTVAIINSEVLNAAAEGTRWTGSSVYMANVVEHEQCELSDYMRAVGQAMADSTPSVDQLPTSGGVMSFNSACQTQIVRSDVEWLDDALNRRGTL
jgi:hypothetical protein